MQLQVIVKLWNYNDVGLAPLFQTRYRFRRWEGSCSSVGCKLWSLFQNRCRGNRSQFGKPSNKMLDGKRI